MAQDSKHEVYSASAGLGHAVQGAEAAGLQMYRRYSRN